MLITPFFCLVHQSNGSADTPASLYSTVSAQHSTQPVPAQPFRRPFCTRASSVPIDSTAQPNTIGISATRRRRWQPQSSSVGRPATEWPTASDPERYPKRALVA
ncbi:hypothetical protein ACQY0O_001373 [Thecaphora frezii]